MQFRQITKPCNPEKTSELQGFIRVENLPTIGAVLNIGAPIGRPAYKVGFFRSLP